MPDARKPLISGNWKMPRLSPDHPPRGADRGAEKGR